jgi:hypothetical protein
MCSSSDLDDQRHDRALWANPAMDLSDQHVTCMQVRIPLATLPRIVLIASPGEGIGNADCQQAWQVSSLHSVVHIDDHAVDLLMGAFRFAKVQLAQTTSVAFHEGDLRQIEDDPFLGPVLRGLLELHARIHCAKRR